MASITSGRSSTSSTKEAEEIGKQDGGKWRACEITETFFLNLYIYQMLNE